MIVGQADQCFDAASALDAIAKQALDVHVARLAWESAKANTKAAKDFLDTKTEELEALILDIGRRQREAAEPALPFVE